MTSTSNDAEPTAAELISGLGEQVSRLVRTELRLAQVEVKDKGRRLGVGGGLAAISGVLAWFAFGTLIAAGVAALALVLPLWASASIIGGSLLLIAGVLGLTARGQASRATPPIPEQAVAGAREDVATIRRSVHR